MKYERLQDLREEKDWTQKYVAYKLNIAQRTYAHYENGTRSIPLELLCSLADLYHVSTDYLLNRTNSRKPYSK